MRTDNAMGKSNLPSHDRTVNQGWMLTCNFAHDLDCWVRLLALHDHDVLARAEPETMPIRLYHLPARLAAHSSRRWLRIDCTWSWASAFTTCLHRLTQPRAAT